MQTTAQLVGVPTSTDLWGALAQTPGVRMQGVDVGGSQSEVTHTQVVSPAVIGQLQPGASVPVKVDPSDHSQLMIGLMG